MTIDSTLFIVVCFFDFLVFANYVYTFSEISDIFIYISDIEKYIIGFAEQFQVGI